MLILRLIAVLLALCIPASAHFRLASHGALPVVVSQTIVSVPLSGTTFPPGASSGTVVGTIGTPVMSPASPAFTGTCCTLSGTDAASFQVVGASLETVGTLCGSPPCTYHINLVATQAGISNSPFSQVETITSSNAVGSLSFVNNSGSSTPGSTYPQHFLKTFAAGDVPNGSIAIPKVGGVAIAYGVDCASDGVNPLRSDGCPSWPDGSLRGIPVSAFMPQLTAGNTGQVVWTTQSGSYSTSSTIVPSSITAVSDYKSVLTSVSSTWVPQDYGQWPNGVQVGCVVSGSSVSSCNLRITPPSVAAGTTCLTTGVSEPVGSFTAKIDNGAGSPGNILTVSSGGAFLWSARSTLRGEIIKDTGYPSGSIAANTVVTVPISAVAPPGNSNGTYMVSGSPQLVSSETMGLIGCSGRVNNGVNGVNNGTGTPAIFTTILGANGFPTSVTLVTGGAGYSLVGSGALTFDVNTLLNLYGSINPPSCAAEAGAGVFSSVTYSGGAVTVNSTTSGHIATGQIIKDSTGATAVVTGSSSPWAVSAALTSGAMTANTPVCIHSSNPVEKGYWMFGPYIDPNTGLADPQLMGSAEVDMWSNGGTPYSVRAIIRTDHEGWQPGQWYQSYTYNADIMNGTAEIRGNAQGAGTFTAITDQVPGDWWSADNAFSGPVGASARMDWLGVTPNTFSESNNLLLNGVSLYLASSDIAYWRASKAMLPMASGRTLTPSVIPTSTTGGNWDQPTTFQGYYQPFGPMFLDTQNAFGSGGDHFFLSPQGAHLAFWIDEQGVAADKGVSWLQQMRVAALTLSGDIAGGSESDTGHAINVDPAFSNTAFTDPVRLGSQVNLGYSTSVPSGQMNIGGQINQHGEIGITGGTSHWPSGTLLGPYLVDGEYYQLKQMDLMAAQALWSEIDSAFRELTFNSTTYHGVLWNQPATRTYAWGNALMNQFANWAPPQEPDAQYWNWVINQNYTSYAAFYPFTGAWSTPANSGTKAFDWTAAGGCRAPTPSSNFGAGPFSPGETTWMCGFMIQALDLAQMWAGGPGNNTNLDFLLSESADKYLIKMGSQNSCPYNAVNYSQILGLTTNQHPGGNAGISYDMTTIPSSDNGSLGQGYPGVNPDTTLLSVAGSNVVTFTLPNGGNAPAPPVPSGSVLNPTNWGITNEVSDAPNPPSPLAIGHQYTWCSTSGAPAASFTGTTSGTGLTVSGVTGTIAIGQYLAGAGITSGTYYITAGSGTNWTLDAAPASVGPETMTTLPTGTINAIGTSCGSPAPMTMATTTPFGAGWIINQSCPAGTGDWVFPGDFGSNTSYPATFWAAYNWRVAAGGSTSDTTAAINLFSPLQSPGSVWTTNPRWDGCTSFSC